MSAEGSIPGFVDLQVNGAMGADFSSPELTGDKFAQACDYLLERGTAAFLPTLVTCPLPVYRRNLPLIADAVESAEFRGRLLGIHLEGPFISREPGFVGAHDARHVLPPDPSVLRRMQEWARGNVRMLTLAAELPGAEELARCAAELGMVVSVGHSAFSEEELARLAGAGAGALTHLGNGLANELHRHHNPIWAGLANDGLTAMIISDGHHLPPSLLKVVLRAKGIEATLVTSDLSPLAGLPPGEYHYWGSRVVLEASGRVYNPQRDCLAGAGMDMPAAMNHLASLGFLTEADLLALGFYNPLRLMGVDAARLPSGTKLSYNRERSEFSVCR